MTAKTAKNKNAAAKRAAAQTRIAAAFRGHLARRPTNVTTLNAIPGRRRVQIGSQAHDASSIAQLMRLGNWRDPLTRTPLTNAQAAAAWRMHTRNQAAEARRAGRQYAAPAMPQRPAGNEGVSEGRRDEIVDWFFSNARRVPSPVRPQRRSNAQRRLNARMAPPPAPPRAIRTVRRSVSPDTRNRFAAAVAALRLNRSPSPGARVRSGTSPPSPGYAEFLALARRARFGRPPSPPPPQRPPSPTINRMNRMRARLAQLAIMHGNAPPPFVRTVRRNANGQIVRNAYGRPVMITTNAQGRPVSNAARRAIEQRARIEQRAARRNQGPL